MLSCSLSDTHTYTYTHTHIYTRLGQETLSLVLKIMYHMSVCFVNIHLKSTRTHTICAHIWTHIQSDTRAGNIMNTLTQTVVSLSRTLIQKALSSITFNYSWQPLALIYTKHVQTSCYTLPPRKGDRRGRQAACLPAEKAFSVHDMDMGFGDPAGARLRLLAGWRLWGRHVASAAMGLGMRLGLGLALCSPGLSIEL